MTAEPDRREPPAARSGAVAIVLMSGLIFIVLAVGVLHALYRWREAGARLAPKAVFPEPRLVTADDGLRDPGIARQKADLERYRWIDQAHGAFQIPIEHAMALVAARGAAAYEPVPAPAPGAKP
jgi:hypothetical protein